MRVTIHPGQLNGNSVSVPSSKSLSHRALIAASLAKGVSTIYNMADNDDTRATIGAMRQLGAKITQEGSTLRIEGTGGVNNYDAQPVECMESGTTLRFLIPLFSLSEKEAVFHGNERLFKRPMNVYEEIFAAQNLRFEKHENEIVLHGALKPGNYTVPGNISSQFISGLLFALPLLEKDSEIHILPPQESRPYIGLTLQILKMAGIVIREEGNSFYIPGNQTYQPFTYTVEGDDSAAAFFLAAGQMAGPQVSVTNLNHSSLQADHAMIDHIRSMGGTVNETEEGYTSIQSGLHAAEIDLADCPDIGPVLFALAAYAKGTTVFRNCARLRFKESDRIETMKEELEKLGCTVRVEKDDVHVSGPGKITCTQPLEGHHDHRVIMALSVLALCADTPVTINGAEAVHKSFPDFFEKLRSLGIEVECD